MATKLAKAFYLLVLTVAFLPLLPFWFDGWETVIQLVAERMTVGPVKIVFWVSPSHAKWQVAQMKRSVDAMNTGGGSACDTICEFSLSTENAGNYTDGVEDADVVAFYMFNEGYKLSELPTSERKAHQIWVMFAREPPPLMRWKDPLQNVFNWTMSYRSDSDVWTPYGKAIPGDGNLPYLFPGNASLEQWIGGKRKLAAAVISNCQSPSQRESLIRQMNDTGVLVDLFGTCGTVPAGCGRFDGMCTEFWQNLAKDYKFYLSFENSLCVDYITEKFWRSMLLGMVPVVYGGGNYAMEAPPGSYIDVEGFSSAMELMTLLKTLSENDTEYAKYFEWRRDYSIYDNKGYSNADWCKLCKAATTRNREERWNGFGSGQSYVDLKDWWEHQPDSTESVCWPKLIW